MAPADHSLPRYWSVDLPGLTEAGASEVVRFASGIGLDGATTVDPAAWLTLHVDRATASALATALDGSDEVCESLLSVVSEWLAATA